MYIARATGIWLSEIPVRVGHVLPPFGFELVLECEKAVIIYARLHMNCNNIAKRVFAVREFWLLSLFGFSFLDKASPPSWTKR